MGKGTVLTIRALVAALAALGPPPLLVLVALAATSALMVSTVPFPTPAALFGRKKGAHEG